MTITQEYLKEILTYNPETGDFTWNISGIGKKKGEVLRSTTQANPKAPKYYRVKLKGTTYKLHRLAWLYMTGEFPEAGVLDHIDRNPLNNRWSNLRNVSQRVNTLNSDFQDNTRTGISNLTITSIRNNTYYVVNYPIKFAFETKRRNKYFPYTEEGKQQALEFIAKVFKD